MCVCVCVFSKCSNNYQSIQVSSKVCPYNKEWHSCMLVPAVDTQDHTVHMEACKPSYNLQMMGRQRRSAHLGRDSSREAEGMLGNEKGVISMPSLGEKGSHRKWNTCTYGLQILTLLCYSVKTIQNLGLTDKPSLTSTLATQATLLLGFLEERTYVLLFTLN